MSKLSGCSAEPRKERMVLTLSARELRIMLPKWILNGMYGGSSYIGDVKNETCP